MPAFPQFTNVAVIGAVALATADAAVTGTPAASGTIVTAGVNGTRIDQVVAVGALAGVEAAKIVRLWIVLDSGPTWFLFDEIVLATVTSSATVATMRGVTNYTNLVLPSGYSLRGTVSVSEAVKVLAFGGSY